MSKNIAVILLAGKGSRLKSTVPKQYIEINKKPVIYYTIKAFDQNNYVNEIILVVDKNNVDFLKNEILSKYNFNKVRNIVLGGDERAFSVKNALDSLPVNKTTKDDIILIQDGVRPFISDNLITKGIEEAKKWGSVVIGVKVKDTVKIVDDNNKIVNTPSRNNLWIAQTPQIFKLSILKKCYTDIKSITPLPTDDSSLVEQNGYTVKMIEGDYKNLKITTKEDLYFASFILNSEG